MHHKLYLQNHIDTLPHSKTKAELIAELTMAQQKISQLKHQNSYLRQELRKASTPDLPLDEQDLWLLSITDSLPYIVYVNELNRQQNLYINSTVSNLLGYPPEMFAAKNWRAFTDLIHPEDRSRLQSMALATTHRQPNEVIDMEYRIKDAAGAWRWLHARETLWAQGTAGKSLLILGVAQDITTRKKIETELEQRVVIEQLISIISSNFMNASAYAIGQEFSWALQIIGEFFSIDRSYVLFFSVENQQSIKMYEWWADPAHADSEAAVNQPFYGSYPWLDSKINQSQTLSYQTIAELPAEAVALKTDLTRRGVQSFVLVPIVSAQSLIGLFGMETTTSARNWSKREIMAAQMLSRILGSGLERQQADLALRQANEVLEKRVMEKTAALQAAVTRLERLYYVSLRLSSSITEPELLGLICQQAQQLFMARGCVLYVYDAPQERLTSALGVGEIKPFFGQVVQVGAGLAGQVLTDGYPIQTTESYHRLTDGTTFYQDAETLKGVIAVPLLKGQTLLGVLEIVAATDKETAQRFDEPTLQLAELFAAQATVALENARLHEMQQEQFRQLQESQTMLIQSEKMAGMGRLVASVTHEINNPLQSIQSCVALIREDLADALAEADLETIANIAEQEIERLSKLVQRMRAFYKRPNGKLPGGNGLSSGKDTFGAFYSPDFESWDTLDIHALLLDVLQLASKELSRHNIQINQEWANNLPRIQASDGYLKQVFLNLILNASEAMSNQGGELTIRTIADWQPLISTLDNLTPASESSTDSGQPTLIRIEFVDTGPGIPEEKLSRLFEPLFTTKETGTGMGLFTSYKIVEAHHGQIMVNSTVNQGTTFAVILPVKQIDTAS